MMKVWVLNFKVFFIATTIFLLTACSGSESTGTTQPTVSSVTPLDTSTGVARNSAVTATFNKDILGVSVDSTSFILAGNSSVSGTVTFDGSTNIATFTSGSDLALMTSHTATLTTGITDLVGNALASDYSWSFTTAEGAWGTAKLIETDNTAGHNASNPQIAFDSSGNAMAVWYQDDGTVDSIWANRYVAGTGWGTAVEEIESDNTAGHDAYDPRIGFDASGNAFAVWYQNDGTVDSIWANRYDAGTGWGTAVEIETDNTAGHDAYLPKIAVDSSGNAIAVWYQNDGTVDSIWANRYDAGTGWGTAVEIETDNTVGHTAFDTQISSDSSGNAIAVWRQSNGTIYSIWANRYDAGTGWGMAELIETDNTAGHEAALPKIAFDSSGNAIAVWRQSNGTVFSIWANRYVAGTGWGTEEVIETDNTAGNNASNPEIAVDSSGNAIAVWQQSNGTVFSIWVNRYVAGTGWGTAVEIETDNTAGHDAALSKIAVDSSGNAIAVWRQSNGTIDSIWANRFE